MTQVKVICKCPRDLHDFEEREMYDKNDKELFLGDLFRCRHCEKEHLCMQRSQRKACNCSHTQEFYLHCEPA